MKGTQDLSTIFATSYEGRPFQIENLKEKQVNYRHFTQHDKQTNKKVYSSNTDQWGPKHRFKHKLQGNDQL